MEASLSKIARSHVQKGKEWSEEGKKTIYLNIDEQNILLAISMLLYLITFPTLPLPWGNN